MELYKKHRPLHLDDVVGQGPTVRGLQTQLKRGTLPHAMLLSGPSGTGKTTLARIISSDLGIPAVNIEECNSSNDRGIDSIRHLIEKISVPPLGGNSRYVIIDEAHGLTSQAQDALLKVLEECPEHTYIALLTTDPGKLKRAIRTRCTHYQLRDLSEFDIAETLRKVSEFEQRPAEGDTYMRIAKASGGSMREALVLLEQCMVNDFVDIDQIITNHKASGSIDLMRAIVDGDWLKTVRLLRELEDWKSSPEGFRRQLLAYCSKVLAGRNPGQAPAVFEIFVDQSNLYSRETIPGLLYFAMKG